MSLKIISIGAAVQDVFLQGKVFEAHCEDKYCVQEFALGTKNDVDSVTITTGGGATNASVTFSRQGLDAGFMGKIGHDVAGKAVLDDLHKENVDTSLVDYSKDHNTGYSTLLLAPNGERTILTYRGASAIHQLKPQDFHGVHADWFYITSLDGDLKTLDTVLDYAEEHKIKVAINPGKKELQQTEQFRKLLKRFDILSLNKEEMIMLFGEKDNYELIKSATEYIEYIVVTDGPNGVTATDGKKVYGAGMYEDIPVVDRTGAGDAFLVVVLYVR
jgi:ribokinase